MGLHASIVQAAFEYGAANGIMANLTRLSRDVLRLARDNWIAIAVAVVILFLLTRPFRRPS